MQSNTVLVVDLDGTLLKTDSIFEALILLIKRNLFFLFILPIWLYRGRAYLKQKLAQYVALDPKQLPYNQPFLEYLKQQKALGRTLILATGSDYKFAHQIADHLGIFDRVIASNGQTNVCGIKKLNEIQCDYKEFVYAGNAAVDLPVWHAAKRIIVITPSKRFLKRVHNLNKPIEYYDLTPDLTFRTVLKVFRIHQWLKNILIFIPLLLAFKWTEESLLLKSIIAFFSFSFCASGIYIINDLLDLPQDRTHAYKKHRPFATGAFPLTWGIAAIPLLWITSFFLASLISYQFVMVLACYLTLTLVYCFYAKHQILLDVIVLALLYVLRIIAGSIATQIPCSEWLLTVSLFLFLSLAFVKRTTELNNTSDTVARGYLKTDLNQVMTFGIISGYISVLSFALFIQSNDTFLLYRNPNLLWLGYPLIIYWVSRIWILTQRGQVHEDPVVWAVKDKMSYLIGILLLITFFAAK
jgi:4-hydroxybenzoate polyprenyltransferase